MSRNHTYTNKHAGIHGFAFPNIRGFGILIIPLPEKFETKLIARAFIINPKLASKLQNDKG